jgi:hypothetical protein
MRVGSHVLLWEVNENPETAGNRRFDPIERSIHRLILSALYILLLLSILQHITIGRQTLIIFNNSLFRLPDKSVTSIKEAIK